MSILSYFPHAWIIAISIALPASTTHQYKIRHPLSEAFAKESSLYCIQKSSRINDLPPESLFIIDGTYMLYNSYHLTVKQSDLFTHGANGYQAILKFSKKFIDFVETKLPKYLVVAFDSEESWRSQLFPNYKNQRTPVTSCYKYISFLDLI